MRVLLEYKRLPQGSVLLLEASIHVSAKLEEPKQIVLKHLNYAGRKWKPINS